jgi:transposase
LFAAHKRSDKISQWLVQLLARVGWQKAVVARANKKARILWAMSARGRSFESNHVSIKPGAILGEAAAAA